ncbi:DUF2982 domain-containing protein [Vibrio palustris]|uniref:DUF2982 domain-containing protein n=1 Tax=Vibrio palustris TaxID=1918946 RepID=A0A1R4B2S3_9VIBR|nr:DUF2982 domain-containing protein [Vibrio palustris]SJL83201.1 hypothetical protein VPAL9027_01150 [Vibrio palustris]
MQTLHLHNHTWDIHSPRCRIVCFIALIVSLIAIMFSPTLTIALAVAGLIALLWGVSYWLIVSSRVQYTLTATHLQQHLAKGGWVVKWNNIHRIDVCQDGGSDSWGAPLPWVGIRLKRYQPYLCSICPRIASDILMDQRSLLYLGVKRHPKYALEDILLDAEPYYDEHGHRYAGLIGMLANRMRYQREFHGYDIYLSASDLDRSPEEFVGLTRRYLAAAESELLEEN